MRCDSCRMSEPDIMLVDIEMPRMDGYDLTRNVRGNKETAQIPIIMITHAPPKSTAAWRSSLGSTSTWASRIQEDELLKFIKQYLAERRHGVGRRWLQSVVT